MQDDNCNTHDPQMCKTCGGKCCLGHPGKFVDPARFFNIFPELKELSIRDLEIALDRKGYEFWKFDGTLSPRPKPTRDGCTFLGETGCTLPREEMPCQCRALIPDIETLLDGEMIHCRMPPEYSSKASKENWLSYWASRST